MTYASTTSFPHHPRLRSFARRFGRAHLDFACHAAFPLALTPDLLYLLWAAFPRDARDQPIGAPWVAVADLLLSSLCDEVGHELFEFEPEVRDELLAELKGSPRFGPARITALASFVSEYVGQQLRSSDPFVRDFAEAQHWAARAATDPASAAAELARAYAELRGTERDRLLRLEAIIEAIARPERASDIESLLPYARALADWARGDQARAAVVLRSMANSTGQIRLGGLVLALPPAIAAPAVVPPANNERRTQSSGRISQPTHLPRDTGRLLSDDEREQLEQTLLAHRRRLQLLEEQYPQRSRSARPEIIDKIAGLRAQIASMERQQLENLRALYRSRLQSAEQQQAQLGMNTPPHTILYIEELRGQVADIERQLDQRQRDDEAQVLAAGPAHNEALEQLREQRDTAQRSLHFLEQQRAYFGPAAPLNVLNDIQETRAQLAQLDAQIKEIAGDIGVPNVKAVEEITHLQALRAIQQRRLSILEEQRAMLGRTVQTEIAIEISVLTQELEATEQRLREYGASLEAPYIPDEVTVPLSIEELNLLEQLRQEHQRRLQFLEAQQAMYDIYTPPHIIMEIEDARVAIARIDGQLGVYQKEKTHASAVSQSSDNSDGDVQPPILGAEEREQLEQLREAHQRRLQTLEYQRARRGNDTPSELAKEIEDIRAAIAALDKRLGSAELYTTNNEIPLDPNAQTRLESLRDAHLDRLQQLERRSATQGSDVHPDVPLEIESIRENIRAIDQQLNAPNEDKVIPQSTEIPTSAVPTRPQLEQQRADILRRLQQLEQRSHLSPEPTPQSATEAADLRRQLDEIERQLATLSPAIADSRPSMTVGTDSPNAEVQQIEGDNEILQSIPVINTVATGISLQSAAMLPRTLSSTINILVMRKDPGYSFTIQGGGVARAYLDISTEEIANWIAEASKAIFDIVHMRDESGNLVYLNKTTSIPTDIFERSLRILAELGTELYYKLFYSNNRDDARAMGDLLTSLSRTRQLRIQVVAERFFFPWAFLFDGDDDALAKPSYDQFWGFKHVIEYLPEFTAGNLINFNPTITVGDTVDMAFVCNNTIDTQFGEPVVQGQRDYFSTLPGISVQDYPNVADLVRLMRGPDSPLLIYFYCHAISKQTGEDGGVDFSRISLSDAKTTIAEMKLKTRSAVERLRQAPLVFLNACESAELSPFLYDGWVPFLLSRGVRGVLGTEVETPAFFGADFAKEFIQRFMTEEQPIGTLLLSLKQAYVEQRKNILGILFVMYANGDIVLSRNKKSSSNEDSIAKSSTNNTNLSTAKVETAIAHSNPDSSSSALASVHSVLLDMLEKLEAVDLPVDDLEDLRDDLRLAIRAITREHPNSQRAADKLFSMSETIKKLKERYPELQSFESTINTAIGLLVSSPNI